jgi:hypothetical protein
MVSLVIGKDTGIITEDEHQVLQLGIFFSLKKYVLLSPTKGGIVAGKSGARDRRVKCPRCNYLIHNMLADGQRMCKS